MNIRAESIEVRARGVRVEGGLRVDELLLTADEGANLDSQMIRFGTVRARAYITEADLSEAMTLSGVQGVTKPDLKLLDRHMKFSGSYRILGPAAVRFTVDFEPHVTDELKLHVAVREVKVAGMFDLPAFVVDRITDQLDTMLDRVLNLEQMPYLSQWESIKVETGRLCVVATAKVENPVGLVAARVEPKLIEN